MPIFFKPNSTPSPSQYTFLGKEKHYSNFRPQWPSAFALASLQRLGLRYDQLKRAWFGPAGRYEPVVLIIGSGTGADVSAFLELNCRVYAVEPNDTFREIALHRFASYGDRFISIKGDAHALNLPRGLKVDLIVCAQALHTFRSEILDVKRSEERARKAWRPFLPNDTKERIAIWYYNLNPKDRAMIELHERLKRASLRYAATQTPLFNAPLFEPTEFQYYIEAAALSVSSAKTVASLLLNKEELMRWLMSYSFGPKEEDAEKPAVIESLSAWFERYKNKDGLVHLPYVGFIAQGPLRRTELLYKNRLQPSPISLHRVESESLFSIRRPHHMLPTQSSAAKSKKILTTIDEKAPSSRDLSTQKTPYQSLLSKGRGYFSATLSSRAKQTNKHTHSITNGL